MPSNRIRRLRAIHAKDQTRHHVDFNVLSHEIAQRQDLPIESARRIAGSIKKKQIERFGSEKRNGRIFVRN